MNNLPDVRFGRIDPAQVDWRDLLDDEPDDDEELAETPDDVIAMLGFDPLDEIGQAQDAWFTGNLHSVDPSREIIPAEEGYRYHGTNLENLHGIVERRALSVHKPNYGTEQNAWPDGGREKRAYFTHDPQIARNFYPEGHPVLLRVPESKHEFHKEKTGDTFTRKPVPLQHIEAYHGQGHWVPLNEAAPGQDQTLDEAFAFDRSSVRFEDRDGHLHVAMANISKATVNPYIGREIPGWQELKLDPNKVYLLLRDPEELKKGASSFGGKPFLIEHRPLNANDHPYRKVIGAILKPVKFNDPYLQAPLVVWPTEAIDLIKSGEQREISCGYRYTPDMRPGKYQGQPYDGVMRDIIGNHVTLVEEGRAGPDVNALVMDEAIDARQWKLIEQALLGLYA